LPAVSQKQRAFLNWRFGHAWVRRHHFANKGKLPTYVRKTSRPTAVSRSLTQGGKR